MVWPMGMAIVVVAVLLVGIALVILKIVPVIPAIALVFIGLFAVVAIGERRDRGRQRGTPDVMRRLDVDRGIVPTDLDHDPYDQLVTYVDTQVASKLADDDAPSGRPRA
jgi:hypothetical protein